MSVQGGMYSKVTPLSVHISLNNFYSLSGQLPPGMPAGCSSAPHSSRTHRAQLPSWNLVGCEMMPGLPANANWKDQNQFDYGG